MLRTATIEELIEPGAIRYGVVQPGKHHEGGVPFLKAGDIGNCSVNVTPEFKIAPEISDKYKRSILRGGEILITLVGNPGAVCIAPRDVAGFNVARAVGVLNVNSEVDNRFLCYALQGKSAQDQIHALLNTTVQATLNLSDLKKIQISVPKVASQKAIAHILGTLDDKIELNQKMNQTLEEIAKAIFKSWFVDFDPVHAKAEGRPTGLPPEISDLFPGELVDSDIGEIPKGWVNCEVRTFVKLNAQSWSKKNHPGSLNYLDLGNIKSNHVNETETYLWDEAPSRARRVLKVGDTIVGTVRPGNKSYGFIQRSDITGSTGFAVLSPLKEEYAEFIYLAVCSDTNIDRLAHLADGAAYPAVSNETVLETSLVRPPSDLVMRFHELVGPQMQRLEVADQESVVLSELRDVLLPKLISGELRIPDAEKFLEEAGV